MVYIEIAVIVALTLFNAVLTSGGKDASPARRE
jgi:hypothetical protein